MPFARYKNWHSKKIADMNLCNSAVDRFDIYTLTQHT